MTGRKRPAAWCAALVLCSCASAPTRFFTLQPVAPAAAQAGNAVGTYQGPAIRVDAVHVPAAWDRIEMVDEIGAGEVRMRDFDQWSAPLGELARQALSADLIARLPEGRVIFPRLAKPAGALGLSVDLLAFTAGADGARLEAAWVLDAAAPDGTPARGSVSLASAAPAAGAAATARALGVLLAQLADRIVAGLPAGQPAGQP